jgi:hypothetical protein
MSTAGFFRVISFFKPKELFDIPVIFHPLVNHYFNTPEHFVFEGSVIPIINYIITKYNSLPQLSIPVTNIQHTLYIMVTIKLFNQMHLV